MNLHEMRRVLAATSDVVLAATSDVVLEKQEPR